MQNSTTSIGTLINVESLSSLVMTGDVVVLDCRFSLTDTSEGNRLYLQSHIPGAHYAHLDHHLSSPIVPGETGRHPLPDPRAFVHQLRRWGVNQGMNVVVYDNAGGAIAARAWWLCQWVGHNNCFVLDGGFNAWTTAALPVSAEVPAPGQGNVVPREPNLTTVDTTAVTRGNRLLVDARDAPRYRGEQEPIDTKAGHIPGALNLPFASNLDDQGHFLPAEELRKKFATLNPGHTDRVITHYCGSGVTAAHNVLAMLHAGYDATDLYAGSWSEWIVDDSRDISTGDETR